MGLPQPLLNALARKNFTTPTPIQAGTIPFALQSRDILGTAQTGTGKTAAFSIPLLTHLINNPQSCALIMTPTRELATQVMQALREMIDPEMKIRGAVLIGGEPMGRQFHQLHQNPRIIVGTPGRINDHLARGSVKLQNTDFLVLDETDRMLDMGFGVQIDKIIARLPQNRQTLLFSATLPPHITKVAARYLKNPERIAIGSTTVAAENLKQEIVNTSIPEKYDTLSQELDRREGSIIIFVRTKHGADRLARKLDRDNHSADAIHGDLRQNQRDRVIRSFRDEKHRIMVATDVAARGLDIPHIRHVINYDLPQCPEDYIHRIGRTARAGAGGSAVCILTPEDAEKWRAINRLMNPGEKQEHGEGRRPHNSKNRRRRRFGNGGGNGGGNGEGKRHGRPSRHRKGGRDRVWSNAA
ncbi:MAG: DEAD/DEAH box helicase [Alphaproteobacteria bacterium]|nr:DEAD/DEAH box helicase [Alphaproteobacteria bacterium]